MNIGIRTGDIKGSSGSSYIEMNGSKVIVSVYGPMEPSMQQQEYALSGIIEVCVEDAWNADIEMETIQHKLQHIMKAAIRHTAYFKTLIKISISVLAIGNSLFDTITLASSLALVDAGIEMKDFVVSCTAGLVNGEYKPFVADESSVRVTIMPSQNEIVETDVNGRADPGTIDQAIQVAMGGCMDIIQVVRSYINSRQ